MLLLMNELLCRFVRLGTASMQSEPGGPFINVEQLDLRKYASRTNLSRVLCDYMIYTERNMKRALELCALATQGNDFQACSCGGDGVCQFVCGTYMLHCGWAEQEACCMKYPRAANIYMCQH